jgi:two-component system, cell cycle sensor histidine kinase and response regulator CckA
MELHSENPLAPSAELARLQHAVALAHLGTWEYDVVAGTGFWDAGMEGLHGIAPGTYDGTLEGWRRAVHPDDWPRVEAATAQWLADPSPGSACYRTVHPDGSIRWLDIRWQATVSVTYTPDGTIRRVVGVAIDETNRKKLTDDLRAQRAQLAALFQDAPVGLALVDADLRYVMVNPFIAALNGIPAEQHLGRTVTEVIPHMAERLTPMLQHVLTTGEAIIGFEGEAPRLTHPGETGRYLVSYFPVVGEDGVPTGIGGVIQDVTEQRRLEDQLRQGQKMEAIGRLAGGIAHDFNNLLTGILSHSELLLDQIPEGPAREDAQTVRQTAERAAALTRQLLAFSRQQRVEPRLVDLNAVVLETQRLLRRTLGDPITLEISLGAIGSVLADPGQLEQVLVNLALNARDAMPAGGRLTIATHETSLNESLAARHSGLPPGVYVTLTVADTGVGISSEDQARIFEPFFTTKPTGQGTGLGLSTVYGLVKQWGGYIAVESAPGSGAAFTIYLPRQKGTPLVTAGQAVRPLPRGTETVLVVEDEATVRRSVRRLLTRHGYTVLEARHGADALRILQDSAAPIALVLTDLVMPEMTGHELIATLKTRPEAPKMLVMSGYEDPAVMPGNPLPAGTTFLAKPFTSEALLAAVRAVLDRDSD